MSKLKDRQRAESGLIFRDGGLVDKDEYLKAHPTPAMRAVTQREVDVALEREFMVRKRVAHVDADAASLPYFCSRCNRNHKPGSKIYTAHVSPLQGDEEA